MENNTENNIEAIELTAKEKLDSFIKENNLSLTTKFVPFSISRNAEEDHKTLNWKVTLTNGKQKLTVDYQKGIAHLPYPQTTYLKPYQKKVIEKIIDESVESGIAKQVVLTENDVNVGFKKVIFPTPDLPEILQCLVNDSNVKDYVSFEEWAPEFGYDPDSRKAEKVYNECKKITGEFLKIIGGVDKIDYLQEVLSEYENENTPKPKKFRM